MMRRKHEEAEKDNSERWLLTYADLITLLMIFFVVLYAMSKVDADKFRAVADSLNRALGGGTPAKIELAKSPQGPSLFETGNPRTDATHPGQNPEPIVNENDSGQNGENGADKGGSGNSEVENMTIEGIKARLDQFAKDNGFQTKLVSSIEERGLVISIQETLLFESGSATITPKAKAILDKVSTVLVTAPNYIKVEGHTDNLPINTSRFPSNWELSVLRATNVVHVLVKDGGLKADRLSATGYGEYRAIADNKNEAGRARNRRVDLVILRSKYDLVEPGNPGVN